MNKQQQRYFARVPDIRLTLWDKWQLWRITRDKTMIDKLKSRKLWVAVVTATIVALSQQLGIDPALAEKLVTLAGAYVLGQGIADHGARAR